LNKKIFLYFVVTLVLTSCGSKSVKNINSRGENIVCFGNSITYGLGASPGHDYPSLLAKKLNLTVINAGKSGDTTEGALQRLQHDVLDKKPYLVIVELGANDYLKGISAEATLKNLEEIIKKIQQAGAMVAITEIHTGFIMRKQASGIRRLAKKYRCLFIPNILEGILGEGELCSDAIHPNDKGYEIIAERVYRAIKPLIARRLSQR